MEAESGRPDRYGKTSPWPIPVALGLVLSEIGILFNLYPVSVGGLVLFVGSLAGIVREAGYVADPWRLLSALGAVLAVLGVLVVSTQVDGGLSAILSPAALEGGVAQRGATIAATGVVVAVAGVVAPHAVNQ